MSDAISSKSDAPGSSKSAFLWAARPRRTNLGQAVLVGWRSPDFSMDIPLEAPEIVETEPGEQIWKLGSKWFANRLIWQSFSYAIVSDLQESVHSPSARFWLIGPLTMSEVRCPCMWPSNPGVPHPHQCGQAFETGWLVQEFAFHTPRTSVRNAHPYLSQTWEVGSQNQTYIHTYIHTLHCITLRYTTLHYITLHDIHYIHTLHTYTYSQLYTNM